MPNNKAKTQNLSSYLLRTLVLLRRKKRDVMTYDASDASRTERLEMHTGFHVNCCLKYTFIAKKRIQDFLVPTVSAA